MKKQFRVKIGRHIEDGKTYQKDEVVVSEKDLCKLFPQKFDDLGPVKEEPLPAPSEEGEDDASETSDPPTKPATKPKAAAKKGKGKDDWEND